MNHCIPRKKKGEIRADLILEYTNLGRPGSNKSLQEVIADVEADMSKNLDFTLEKRGKNFILKCGKNEVALDPTKAWKQQIFKEPSGIPFVSDGKVSERCVNIFQKHEEAEAAAEVEGKPKDEKASSSSKVEVASVPLPGAASAPGTPASLARSSAPATPTEQEGTVFKSQYDHNANNQSQTLLI